MRAIKQQLLNPRHTEVQRILRKPHPKLPGKQRGNLGRGYHAIVTFVGRHPVIPVVVSADKSFIGIPALSIIFTAFFDNQCFSNLLNLFRWDNLLIILANVTSVGKSVFILNKCCGLTSLGSW